MYFEYEDDIPSKKDLLEDDDEDDGELLLTNGKGHGVAFRPGATPAHYRLKRLTDEQLFARNCRVIVPYDEEQVNKNNNNDSDEELERSKSLNLDERVRGQRLWAKGFRKEYN